MMRSQYVRKIINEVVGQEYLRIDTTTPGYIGFFKAHTDGLSPEEAADYEKPFQNQMQFISDFKYCFLGIYIDYCTGRINYSVEEVVREIIAELIKFHYPTEHRMILHDKECQGFISGYVKQFKDILKNTKDDFDFNALKNSGGASPVDNFAYVNGHQLVNVISIRLEEENDLVPLQLYKSEEDGEGLDDNAREEEYIPDYLVQLHNAAINRQKSIKAKWGCSIALLIVILLMVYLTTASLNPLDVYNTDNMLAKAIISVLAGLLAILFLPLLSMYIKRLFNPNFDPNFDIFGMRKSVEIGTGRPAKSAICPSCGLSVFLNNDTLGLPIVCHTCHVAWHDGPKCYRKGMPPSNDILPSYPCPNCRSSGNSMAHEE
jgi:hypothetical protein